MNLSITPKFQTFQRQNQTNQNKSYQTNSTVSLPKYSHTLVKDTVSFGNTPRQLVTVADHLQAQIAADSGRLSRIATTYLDVLESVASGLKEKGFLFDRAYCELNPVKSPKSYTSKVVRSGQFKVPDTIRATLYCNNAYDLSVLNDGLLPEMQKRGYILSSTERSIKDLVKRGYVPNAVEEDDLSKEITVPDLDIRLENVSEQVTKLDPRLRYSISKPQKSGYEDIQMRFIRDFDKKKNPIQHELIILFGPNYSKAKHDESNHVYNALRKFEELTMKFTDDTVGSHSQKANRYIELITQMFRGKISEKLFLNAKNKDLYDISDEIPIHFSETDINMFNNYFSGLQDRMTSVYAEAKKAANISDSAKKQLAKDLRHDRACLNEIKEKLASTIEHYNYQSDLKQT